MNGPERLPLEEITKPGEDQLLIELRFVNSNGDTEVWMLKREAFDIAEETLRTKARLAYLDQGVDSRLATQRASIERLQKHVKHHHDFLESEGYSGCNFNLESEQ